MKRQSSDGINLGKQSCFGDGQLSLENSVSEQRLGLFDPNTIIQNRAGDVLIKKTILKSDHFPGCQNKELLPLLDGAPNFRKVEGLEVYGVAIPTITGLRTALDYLGASQGRRKVKWFNMREEPLIYINGRPYVVREVEHPFANLEYTGIDRERVENMEARLKSDVLNEAEEYNSMVLVTDETDDFQMVYQYQGVTKQDVQTPLEVYAELKEDGYDVEYTRVPVTDEKAPKERDCDLLIEKCWESPKDAPLVFNCQMGRGRTTTGMIIASLVQLKKIGAFPPFTQQPQDGTPAWFTGTNSGELSDGSPRTDAQYEDESRLYKGNYAVIRSLVRVLSNGTLAKSVLDKVVDACSDMQNLREAITKYRARMYHETQEEKRQTMLTLCQQYLERYYVLIAFASYLASPAFSPIHPQDTQPNNQPMQSVAFQLLHSSSQSMSTSNTTKQSVNLQTSQNGQKAQSFGEWMRARPELRSVLNRLLGVNPLVALEMHRALEGEDLTSPGVYFREEEEPKPTIVSQREGQVLGQHTILKADHFPGIHQPGLDQVIPGAPNFRPAVGYRVYGVGIPSGEGIRRALKQVQGSAKRRIVWHNMREEPVVYIKEEPFVLREEDRPYKNMREYKGINAERLEDMETRLKQDILAEADRYNGQILLMKERPLSFEHGRVFGELYDEWVQIQDPHEVCTPRQLYEVISKEENHNLDYYRVPITDGTSPEFSDIEFIVENCKKAGQDAAYVFSCQLGKGRTTVGMVLGCMLSVHLLGKPLSYCLQYSLVLEQDDTELSASSSLGLKRVNSEEIEGSSPSQSEEDDVHVELDVEFAQDNVYREGGYKGIRRVVRVLEMGEAAKEIVDRVIDRCDTVINLRTVINRYRRPRQSFRFYRPEMQVRAQAFKRGAAYLSRYCLLIAFAAYLQTQAKNLPPFKAWMDQQAALAGLFKSIQENPGTALDILPPVVRLGVEDEVRGQQGQVDLKQERLVLARRRGNILTKRTILKSYYSPDVFNQKENQINIYGVSDIRQIKDLPLYTTANPSIEGLRGLLKYFNAVPGGSVKLLISDLREEPVLFIQGQPYMQRDIELPMASHHHAGIYYMQLQYMEQQLQADIVKESSVWGGKILIHRELPPSAQKFKGDRSRDVTSNFDVIQNLAVVPFWVEVGDEQDVLTPLQVHAQLKSEGFQVSYRRIPLSRARTPVAKDIDFFHEQASSRLECQRQNIQAIHLIISRTAQGSSQRFGSSLLATHIRWANNRRRCRKNSLIDGEFDDRLQQLQELSRMPSVLGEHRELLHLCQVLPSGTECKRAVNFAIGNCAEAVGNIVEDIRRCKESLSTVQSDPQGAPGLEFAARQLGLHYLKRYFLLITYRCYLHESPEESFSEWFDSRQELSHLLNKLTLDS